MTTVTLGKNIKHERTENKISQEEFADSVCIQQARLSRIESDKVEPTLTELVSICKVLKIALNRLFEGTTYFDLINPDSYQAKFELSHENLLKITNAFEQRSQDMERTFHKSIDIIETQNEKNLKNTRDLFIQYFDEVVAERNLYRDRIFPKRRKQGFKRLA